MKGRRRGGGGLKLKFSRTLYSKRFNFDTKQIFAFILEIFFTFTVSMRGGRGGGVEERRVKELAKLKKSYNSK